MVLQYWIKNDHCAFQMMKSNMGIYNEEAGEMSFAILSRYVLGDSVKDNFDHMNKVFALLPVFRDIKNDVQTDNNIRSSLSWRHQVKDNSDEVEAAGVFFKAVIRNIVQGRHTSYDGSVASMKNFQAARNHQVGGPVLPVLMSLAAVQTHVAVLTRKLGTEINRFYVWPYSDVFPDARPAPDVQGAQWQAIDSENESDDDVKAADNEDDQDDEETDNDHDEGDAGVHSQDDSDDDDADDDDSTGYHTPPSGRQGPIVDQLWSQVSDSNSVLGQRRRTPTTPFSNSRRRVVWISPKQ